MKSLLFYALAALLYVAGGASMKYSAGLTRWAPTLALTVAFSAGALIQAWAMRQEPLGTSYTVVLGLEAFLALAAGMFLFGERITPRAATGVALVVIGIAVLRAP
jgi:multidrug transporter EmrE-like cation transporter